MLKARYYPTKKINLLEDNPRSISGESLNKLVKSIQDNLEYFEARPIILSDRTGELVAIAGNQRLKAAVTLGLLKVPGILIPNLTEEKEREIIIRDNVSNGDWDWELLNDNWDYVLLKDYGVDVLESDYQDYSESNKELDIDSFEDEMVIKLNYTSKDYHKVKEALSNIAATPEQAIWSLLNLY